MVDGIVSVKFVPQIGGYKDRFEVEVNKNGTYEGSWWTVLGRVAEEHGRPMGLHIRATHFMAETPDGLVDEGVDAICTYGEKIREAAERLVLETNIQYSRYTYGGKSSPEELNKWLQERRNLAQKVNERLNSGK